MLMPAMLSRLPAIASVRLGAWRDHYRGDLVVEVGRAVLDQLDNTA